MKRGILLTCILVAGCATNPNYGGGNIYPQVDKANMPGDYKAYRQDVQECNAYNRGKSAGKSAVDQGLSGAAIGAGLGAITAAFFGADMGKIAGFGAIMGGAKGAAGGATRTNQNRWRVVSNCLEGRGYSVLE